MSEHTMYDALERYRKNVSCHKKSWHSESSRIDVIQRHPLSQKFLRKIKTEDIASYRDDRLSVINSKTGKLLSPDTVLHEMRLLSHMFDIARIEWKWCGRNPCEGVRKPRQSASRTRRLTPREKKRILDYAEQESDPSFLNIVIIALETAMRQGEILSITWNNIDLSKRIVHLPETKNGTVRNVPLTMRAKEAFISQREWSLEQKLELEGKVFDFTAAGLKSKWRKMKIDLKIDDLHFHDMRHEAISTLFEMDRFDIMEISQISGHKSLNMLKRYTHLRASRLVKKLDGKKGSIQLALIRRLQEYPALITQMSHFGCLFWHIVFPDFEEMNFSAKTEEDVIERARLGLLEQLINDILENRQSPIPDTYEQENTMGKRIMINPIPILKER